MFRLANLPLASTGGACTDGESSTRVKSAQAPLSCPQLACYRMNGKGHSLSRQRGRKMLLREILQSNFLRKAEVVFGEEFLDYDVVWCVPDNALKFENYIMPGLLLLTVDGSPFGDVRHLCSLIGETTISGIVYFSDKDPRAGHTEEEYERARQAYAEIHTPLIRMPKNTNILSFMKRFVSTLSSREADEFRFEEWLRDLTFGTGLGTNEAQAVQNGYNPDFSYYCLRLVPKNKQDVQQIQNEVDARSVSTSISKRFSLEDAPVLSFVDKSRDVIAFLPWRDGDDTKILRDAVIDAAKHEFRTVAPVKWYVTMGSCAQSLSDFHNSYLGTIRTSEVIEALGVHEKASFYDDWYMHMLLLKEPKSELRAHMEHTLKPILDSPDLLETLANYLVYGENLKETAEKMFIHVNTLKYRLKKISELLGVDLRDPNVRFRLRMAITIERFLRN